MKCNHCQGTGTCGKYDGQSVACVYCEGVGRLTARETIGWAISSRVGMLREWLTWSRLGRWWWKFYGIEAKARQCARGATSLSLSARLGHSEHRARTFAKAIEDGVDIGFVLDQERRLSQAYAMALKMVQAREMYEQETHP